MVPKKFQIYSVEITAGTFVNQKIEFVHFYSWPLSKLSPRFLSLFLKQKGIAHSSQTVFSEDSKYLPQNKTMKKNTYLFYLIQNIFKDILKCPFLHQLYTIRYKYTNVQYIYIYIYIYI